MQAESTGQKGDKREATLQAALELVAESGFQHTPMSQISKRSGASAGIIYHYFTSKEDLLASLYQRIKGGMSRAIVVADDQQQPLAKRFQTLWLSIFRYCLAHPQEMAFLEQYESIPVEQQSAVWEPDGKQTIDGLLADLQTQNMLGDLPLEAQTIYRLIADLRAQDLIKDLPMIVIGEFAFNVPLRLARQAASGQMDASEGTLLMVAKACWDAVAR